MTFFELIGHPHDDTFWTAPVFLHYHRTEIR
jgi:hypothetical protein